MLQYPRCYRTRGYYSRDGGCEGKRAAARVGIERIAEEEGTAAGALQYPRVLFTRWRLGLVVRLEAQDRRIVIPDDMVDSRIRGYPPSRWRLWEVFGSNLACLTLGLIAAFYRQGA